MTSKSPAETHHAPGSRSALDGIAGSSRLTSNDHPVRVIRNPAARKACAAALPGTANVATVSASSRWARTTHSWTSAWNALASPGANLWDRYIRGPRFADNAEHGIACRDARSLREQELVDLPRTLGVSPREPRAVAHEREGRLAFHPLPEAIECGGRGVHGPDHQLGIGRAASPEAARHHPAIRGRRGSGIPSRLARTRSARRIRTKRRSGKSRS